MAEKGHTFNHVHIQSWESTELLTDGGFEDWSSATDLASWTETKSGTSTVNREATTIHGGTYAVRFDVDSSNSAIKIAQQIDTTGQAYVTVSLWYNIAGAGDSAYILIKDSADNVYLSTDHITWSGTWTACKVMYTSGGVYANTTFSFIPHASYTDYIIEICKNDADSASLYFDDASMLGYKLGDMIEISDGVLKVAGTQVIGPRVIDARATAVANSGDATTDGLIDALRDAMITHGIIAAS